MADTSVGVFPPGHVGPSVCILVVVSMKIWVGAEDCPTTDMLVGRNAGMDESSWQVGRWLSWNKWGGSAPVAWVTPAHQEFPMAKEFFSCPLVGESNTRLNMVIGGGWQLSVGLSIWRPSNMSRVVMVTNSPMARHNSLTLSTNGWTSGLIGR